MESINNGLLNLELTFTHLQTESSIFTIINHASDIMMYIQIADIADPVGLKIINYNNFINANSFFYFFLA